MTHIYKIVFSTLAACFFSIINLQSSEYISSKETKDRDYYKESADTKSKEKYINEVLLPDLEKNPNNTVILNCLAQLYALDAKWQPAELYAKRSLSIKAEEKNLEICVYIYMQKNEYENIAQLMPKIEKLEKLGDPLFCFCLLVATHNKDYQLFLKTLEKLDSEYLKNSTTLDNIKTAARVFHAEFSIKDK